jgi:hypothetical protein
MPQPKRLAALLAVVAMVTVSAGCGSNGINGSIPAEQASALLTELDAVQGAADRGQCVTAAAGADRFVAGVNALPASAGAQLKAALRDAGSNLKTLAADCAPSGATGAFGAQRDRTNTDTTTSTAATEPTTTTSTTTAEPTPTQAGSGRGGGAGQGSPTTSPGGSSQGTGNGSGQGTGTPSGGSSGGTGGTGGTGVGTG